jgi:hypothetical protein
MLSPAVSRGSGRRRASPAELSQHIYYTHSFLSRQVSILTSMRSDDLDHPTDQTASSKTRWGQERRLHFIDFRLQWEGRINRGDLTQFFGISVPQASTDIAKYSDVAAHNIDYNASSKYYYALPGFRRVYPTSGAGQYLAQLLALDRGVLRPEESFLGKVPPMGSAPIPTRTVDEATLKRLVRAITESRSVEIDYYSITSVEATSRRISPHAFGHDGLRWHVRAYCHLREDFRDFVIGRILESNESDEPGMDARADTAWHNEVTLVLAPHPDLKPDQRRGIEFDYGMDGGCVTMKCRQAMLYYVLRRLDLEDDGKPRPSHRQVVIANLSAIAPLLPASSKKKT